MQIIFYRGFEFGGVLSLSGLLYTNFLEP